jgi:hypothetical protein
MPTNRHRRRHEVRAPLSEPLARLLATGACGPANGGIWSPSTPGRWEPLTLTSDELARRWSAVRDDVLADWIAEHPGTRPHGWWLHDATAPRWWITDTGPWAPRIAADRPGWRYTRGIQVEDAMGGRAEVVESEAAYLHRLGQLPSAERRRLPQGAFAPVRVADDDPDAADVVPGGTWDRRLCRQSVLIAPVWKSVRILPSTGGSHAPGRMGMHRNLPLGWKVSFRVGGVRPSEPIWRSGPARARVGLPRPKGRPGSRAPVAARVL